MAKTTGLIILGCWIILIAYWTVSAAGQKPVADRQSRLSQLPYRFLYGIGILLFVYPGIHQQWSLTLTPTPDWVRVAGAAICGLGLIFTLWARRTLGGNWSGDVTFKQGHNLIRTGPYRLVRHPIYTGLLVMFLGTAVNSGLVCSWVGLLVVAISFWIKLKQEEKIMLKHFPDTYPAYQKQVKALVPFII
jgi:protein-S-isoprenylcysteine O-methyltransferase Ste14